MLQDADCDDDDLREGEVEGGDDDGASLSEDQELGEEEAEAHDLASSMPLDTWTRKGFKAAKAAEAADTDGNLAKQDTAPRFQAAAAILPGVHDTWASHMDKQLGDAELGLLQSSASHSKHIDAPEHPDYKVCQNNQI